MANSLIVSPSVSDEDPCLRTAKCADLKYRTLKQYTVLNLLEGCLHPSLILCYSFEMKLLLNPEQVFWIWISKAGMKRQKRAVNVLHMYWNKQIITFMCLYFYFLQNTLATKYQLISVLHFVGKMTDFHVFSMNHV